MSAAAALLCPILALAATASVVGYLAVRLDERLYGPIRPVRRKSIDHGLHRNAVRGRDHG